MKLQDEVIVAQVNVRLMQADRQNAKSLLKKITLERNIHNTWKDIKKAKRWLKWSAQ